MPTMSRRELLDRIDELETENETLQDQLDKISDIIAPVEDDEQGDEAR